MRLFVSATVFYALLIVLSGLEFSAAGFLTALVFDMIYEGLSWFFSSADKGVKPIPKVVTFYIMIALFTEVTFGYQWFLLAIIMDSLSFITKFFMEKMTATYN